MAMIDYGAIAFKNGKLISTDVFTPMKDMVGWEDSDKDTYEYNGGDRPLRLKGNYFAYIGDKNTTIGFYKEQIFIAIRKRGNKFYHKHIFFNDSGYTWTKWEYPYLYGDCNNLKVTKRNGYLVAKWMYNGDKYKVYFGYGVDFAYYKKWKIVNYYRSLEWTLRSIKRWFKDKINDWKYDI